MIQRLCGIVFVALAVTACSGTPTLGPTAAFGTLALPTVDTSTPPSDAPSASPERAVPWGPVAAFLSPQQMEARNEGVLRITDRCTFLERGNEREFLAWPAERARWNPADRSITFQTRSGDKVTVRDGHHLVLGGGGSSRAEGGETGAEWAAGRIWVAAPDPTCLVDVRWEISEVEP